MAEEFVMLPRIDSAYAFAAALAYISFSKAAARRKTASAAAIAAARREERGGFALAREAFAAHEITKCRMRSTAPSS